MRVPFHVEELWWIRGTDYKFPITASNHHERSNSPLPAVFAVYSVVVKQSLCTSIQIWDQRVAVHWQANVEGSADKIDQCREDIYV